MPLTAGQSLSFYEILGPIGAGAMGEVYRARDTRLEREVALKVLPDELADDEERLRRFEREAKTLATLNHPNVAGIHGVDQEGDVCFLALELVPGEDLASRLASGPLPVNEAVDCCRQLAEGLEAAHEAHVVHRDLKPANVRVTPDGVVKVLDFGLAKPLRVDASGGEADVLSTEDGRVLGTPAYMSPEQARGRAVDARSDVWAFGCILFECLTGRRAFEGGSVADVLVAIAEREPDWRALPSSTPPSVLHLLRRCLDKDVRARLQAIGEARIVLEHPNADGPERPAAPQPSASSRALAVAVAVLGVAIGYVAGSGGESEVPRTLRLGVELPPGRRLDLPNPRSGGLSGVAPPLAISADGEHIAYLAREGEGASGLHVRPLDRYETRLLDGTDNAEAPFFSPDGRWVGFFGDAGIYKVAVDGGSAPVLICPLAVIDRPSASWAHDGTILFSRGINAEGRIERVAATGGPPEELTVPDFAAGDSWHGLPQLLPDGRTVLFTIASRAGSGTRAALLDLETGEHRLVADTGEAAGARYLRPLGSETGLLLFAQSGRLLAAGFDLESGGLTGVPWPVVDQVSSSALGIGHWDCSENGALVYVSGNVPETELIVVDRQGEVLWQSPEVGVYQHPRFSHDGGQLLFDWIRSGGRDIWIYDLDRSIPRRLTFEYQNMDPLWTPDGRRIVFSRFVENVRALHLLDPGDVDVEPQRLLEEVGGNQIAGTWTPKGELLFTVFGADKEDLWLLPSLEGGDARAVLQGPGRQGFGAIHPTSGRFLAYTSDKSGLLEVYVCTYPELSDERRITFGGGSEPLWSWDGTELFFRKGVDFGEFFAAPVSIDDTDVRVGDAVRLFAGSFDRSPSGHQHFDASRDGERFALVKALVSEARSELRVIWNWWAGEGVEGEG